eukprot:SAG11_NODE_192_length_12931_cov_5.747682_11_plen_45_part_00
MAASGTSAADDSPAAGRVMQVDKAKSLAKTTTRAAAPARLARPV